MAIDPNRTLHPVRHDSPTALREHRDVVIVGARAAGASTAMLLARAGVDVLVVDRAGYGTDTLSSHALMRGGVEHLRRWGLLDRVAAATPAIHRSVFEFGGEPLVVDAADGVSDDPLYAPRRTVLDPILVDAAREAGAEFRFGTRMVDVVRDRTGRARGIDLETADGRAARITADLVIGADGLRSLVARCVDAAVTRRGHHCLASIYSYVRDADLSQHDYRFAYDGGEIGGSIPTNEGMHCVFVSMAPQAFRRGVQLDAATVLECTLARVSPSIAEGARAGSLVGPIRSFPGHPGQLRSAHGPGWALVGDAGYFKDPAAAHGLSDAFRDAELLVAAIVSEDLDAYQRVRDNLSMPLFGHIEKLAALDWDAAGARDILIDFAASMAAESRALAEHRDAVRSPVG